ncbi:VOC family protein [Amycolatopsis sp. FDAARGOS 1241]|uniref:VOC family protein n=1 Tax=Amycolatopsis sp. FDAARGOS 1241 TaxID=2778070 RepID=UPI00194DC598|nr:VOC family protein [Amycolatopsis sp. FDAARGOS 1241]QRP44507.1 VOC family protein [Amycolatopsis sp. FDAARGOS 1241]
MPSVVENTTFDCRDAYALAQFWSGVLGRPIADGDSPGDPEVGIELGHGGTLLFIEVPESKTVKNRVHLCLRPDVARDTEVGRLLAAGATMFDDRRRPDGTGWAVLLDPEGNEFCVLRSKAEKAATA